MSTIKEKEFTYMRIVKQEDLAKTSVFLVLDRRGDLLGQIRWWATWRQYCFFPNKNRVFSQGCLNDICSFLDELKEERRNQK